MRTLKQECYYNIGRMFHQMGIIHMAVHYYEKALNEPVPLVETIDEEGNSMTALLERYSFFFFGFIVKDIKSRQGLSQNILSRVLIRTPYVSTF